MKYSIPIALFFSALLATSAWAVPAPKPLAADAKKQATVTYKVKKGDSLYTIGRRNGIPVKELQRLNNLKGSALKPGQLLVLHRGKAPSAEKKARQAGSGGKSSNGSTLSTTAYKVKKGDTLYAIARRNGLSVQELKRFNGLKGNALRPGQKLLLAQIVPPPPPAIAPSPDPAKLLRQEADLPVAEKDSLEEVAYTYLSTPYRFGGSSRKGIDCSSFVRNVFRELKIELPRTAREQYRLGAKVDKEELQSGDLLFFRTYAKYPSHVGIYLGERKMIHASPRSRRVVISSMDTPYFRKRYIGAKRLAQVEADALDLDLLTRDVEEVSEDDMDGPAGDPVAEGEIEESGGTLAEREIEEPAGEIVAEGGEQ